MTIKEIAEKVLIEKTNELHVEEIAKRAIQLRLTNETDDIKLSTAISTTLANDISKRRAQSIFRRVKNNKGGYRKGYYKLKRKRSTATERIIGNIPIKNEYFKPNANTLYIGKGGECSVMSELLFNGYNANIMAVDEGIDIVASKNDKFYYIQVKTTYVQKDKLNVPSIKFKRFNQYEKQNTFYIIVLRYYKEKTPRNEFLIFRSSDIEKYLETGKIRKEIDKISITVKFEKNKILLCNGNNIEDIQYHFNNFESLK